MESLLVVHSGRSHSSTKVLLPSVKWIRSWNLERFPEVRQMLTLHEVCVIDLVCACVCVCMCVCVIVAL